MFLNSLDRNTNIRIVCIFTIFKVSNEDGPFSLGITLENLSAEV